ncbi:KH domain-containing protein [Peptostreptococcus faecalis]|uniref:hypothetical protein n=1 Tax=Peptostreptococcus faecalis TaxID=2045015 RepID=UPI000C7D27BD|nr:hypothetical protein [Peptostreptococcus faecalis]
MKFKHWLSIVVFIVLAIFAGFYLNSKHHRDTVKIDDTYPEKVLEQYYELLELRDGRNVPNGMMPYEEYKRWYLYDDKNRVEARLTAKMMKNMKNIKVNNIKQIDYTGKQIEFPRRDNSVESFPLDDTQLYEVTYDVTYFDTKDKSVMYSEYNNKNYKKTDNKVFKNKKEKVWMVKLNNGSWKIAKFEQIN